MKRLNFMSYVIIAMGILVCLIWLTTGRVSLWSAICWVVIAIIAHLQLISERSK